MADPTSNMQLIQAVILLGAAVVVVPLFNRLGLGSVLGYLVAGLIVGPFGLRWFTEPEAILHVAELGIVMFLFLFLFLVGLEMRPSRLWSLWRQIFGLGMLQIVACVIALTLVGRLLGRRATHAIGAQFAECRCAGRVDPRRRGKLILYSWRKASKDTGDMAA